MRNRLVCFAVTGLWSLGAQAASVLIVTQTQVPQYKQVAAAVMQQVASAKQLDLLDGAAVHQALSQAPDIIVAIGTKAFDLARAEAPNSVIVAAALLSPSTHGRKDISAVPLNPRAEDTMATLRALAPQAKRLLAVHPPDDAPATADAQEAARQQGITLDFYEFKDFSGFQEQFRGLLEGHDAVWIMPDARIARPELVKFMVSTCLERRIPLLGFVDGMTRAGALASVSADYAAIGRDTGRMVNAIAGKAKAERINIPMHFSAGLVSVNTRTRDALDLKGQVPAGATTMP